MKKVLSRIFSVVVWVILLTLVCLMVGTKLIGFTSFAVLSGSMEPKYAVGSMVYVKESAAIQVGDCISFYINGTNDIATHQVIAIQGSQYTTKGLANATPDVNPVAERDIIGKVYFCIPYMGYFSDALTSPLGITCFIGMLLAWFFLTRHDR